MRTTGAPDEVLDRPSSGNIGIAGQPTLGAESRDISQVAITGCRYCRGSLLDASLHGGNMGEHPIQCTLVVGGCATRDDHGVALTSEASGDPLSPLRAKSK